MIVKIALPLAIDKTFDYYLKPRGKVFPLQRVLVDFHDTRRVGFVAGFAKGSKRRLKPVLEMLDTSPLLEYFYLAWAKDISKRYFVSLGKALEQFFPPYLRRPRIFREQLFSLEYEKVSRRYKPSWRFFATEADAFINDCRESIKRTLDKGRQVLFITPLTKDIDYFQERLKGLSRNLGFLFSQQKEKEFFYSWLNARNLKTDMLISTRVGIFSSLPRLGLIIVDKEYSDSYKQRKKPYYHLRDLVFARASFQAVNIVLGGMLPSLEVYKGLKNRRALLKAINLCGDKKVSVTEKKRLNLSAKVFINRFIEAIIRDALPEKRVIILYNRRGYARFLYCPKCGSILKCPRCQVSLSYNFTTKKLVCPRCAYSEDFKDLPCPRCKNPYIHFRSWGIEKLEKEFRRRFPQLKVARFDRERKEYPQEFNVLFTTQIIFNYPVKTDIFIILDADNFLNVLDFRSSEKLFRLLCKALTLTRETLIVCTSSPEFYVFTSISQRSIAKFYQEEARVRKSLGLAPYGHMALLMFRARRKNTPFRYALNCYEFLKRFRDLEVLEPQEYGKMRSWFYVYLLVKSQNLMFLERRLKKVFTGSGSSGVKVSLDIE